MSTKIHIVMAADAGYQKGLEVAKASMIASCSEPERLEFHLYEEDPVLSKRILREFGTYKGSPMTFLRLYLGELLPDVDWVIWSDVDTLWYRDVIELASLFDESKTIQWVKDADWAADELVEWCKANNVPMGSFDVARYACAGVCILNLRRWRETHMLERCAEFAAKYGCPRFMEQDMLNILLASESGMLPSCWDVLIPKPEDSFNCVLHIIDVGRCFKRPYHGKVVEYLWWEHEARMTEFRKPWSLPFFVRRWMVRLILPFADKYFAIVYTGGSRGDGFCEGFVSVGECVASDDSGNGAYGKGLDGVYMEIAFRARRCSIPVASLHPPETGKRLLVAALREFGKFSWRFDVCSNRQFCF